MKILSAEESKNIVPLKHGRLTLIYVKMSLLAVGEILVLEKSDWKAKYSPYILFSRTAKSLKREFEWGRHPDGNGWVVKRIS